MVTSTPALSVGAAGWLTAFAAGLVSAVGVVVSLPGPAVLVTGAVALVGLVVVVAAAFVDARRRGVVFGRAVAASRRAAWWWIIALW